MLIVYFVLSGQMSVAVIDCAQIHFLYKKPEISCDILGLNFRLKNMLQMIVVIMLIRHFGESGHIIIK